MAHSHDHGGHNHGPARNARPLVAALAIIGAFFVVETIGALITGSLALLADAGHMLSDVAALGLALFAFWIARRPATPERTYGYHRIEVLAAGANATTLVVIALYIFWEAYQRISEPPEIATVPMLVVAVAGLAANIAAAFVLHGGSDESINTRGAFLHVLTDMLGSVGAILAGAVMHFTGWYYADPLFSVLIGLLVLYSGVSLLRETVDILMEAAPRHLNLEEVEKGLLALPTVLGVHDLHVWTVTSGFLAMSGHLKVTDPGRRELLGDATQMLRERFGIGHVTIQIEGPDEQDGLNHGCNCASIGARCVGTSIAGATHHHH